MRRRRYPLLAPRPRREPLFNPLVWILLAAWAAVIVAALYIGRELL